MTSKRSWVSFQRFWEVAQTDAVIITRLPHERQLTHMRQVTGQRESNDDRASQRHLKVLMFHVFPCDLNTSALSSKLWSEYRPLTFLIIGRNHNDTLRSNQALRISFLRITCQAYTYHHFRVLRMKLKPSPLKCKYCHKLLKALLPKTVEVGSLKE